jgi:glycosyltransferase involved in cell wall biosynthesis
VRDRRDIPAVALLYDADAYVERLGPPRPGARGALGLIGRQVAGQGFLDAFLTHALTPELVALVRGGAGARSFEQFYRAHPSTRARGRGVRVVAEAQFFETFFPDPPARQLYSPCPLDARFAWARQQGGPGGFALSGVTHTLCSQTAVAHLCNLVTAPFEPYDALICTSRAVADMVRVVTGSYAAYLGARHGCTASVPVRLETIPLGIDTNRYRPATAAERAAMRGRLSVGDDAVAVLFVGRLSHHAKAHPYPMFRGCALAAEQTGRPVHLILAGWFPNRAVHEAFVAGARDFAPGVRTTFVDATRPETRFAVWHAADVFVSLSDNVQETFGLSVAEAMACALPVVASDWDGYRDLVIDGATGYLVPTAAVAGAITDATARLLFGAVSYDHFLAECSQATTVDIGATAAALARLVADPGLRRQLGDAGRQRALNTFAWAHIIRAYEALWRNQEGERRDRLHQRESEARWTGPEGPAFYPAPERSFAGYPTRHLGPADTVVAAPGAALELELLLKTPLVNHVAWRRVADPALLASVLERAGSPCSISALDEVFRRAGVGGRAGRASLAWLLKYGLLRYAFTGRG